MFSIVSIRFQRNFFPWFSLFLVWSDVTFKGIMHTSVTKMFWKRRNVRSSWPKSMSMKTAKPFSKKKKKKKTLQKTVLSSCLLSHWWANVTMEICLCRQGQLRPAPPCSHPATGDRQRPGTLPPLGGRWDPYMLYDTGKVITLSETFLLELTMGCVCFC